MLFDLANYTARQGYNLLTGLIAPRPIALITSLDVDGRINAAPYSAFNYLCTDPPVVAIGVGNLPGREVVGKDTARNIRNTRQFVVNVVTDDITEAMNVCAIDFPPGVNELEMGRINPGVFVHRLRTEDPGSPCGPLNAASSARLKSETPALFWARSSPFTSTIPLSIRTDRTSGRKSSA